MLPLIVAPTSVPTPPQAIDMSPITGPTSDAALGRLPTRVVPQAVTTPKADDQRGSNAQARSAAPAQPAPQSIGLSNFDALMNAGKGEIKLPSPFSTTFIAQMFGQYDSTSDSDTAVTSIWLSNGRVSPKESGMLEFERVVEQQNMVKYAPSAAKPLVSGATGALQEWRAQNAQALTYRRNTNKQEVASLFVGGVNAYSSAQARALSNASARPQEVSVVM